MIWVKEKSELYYFVVKYKDFDKKERKFYYLARDTGVHHMSADLWIHIVDTLAAEDIYLSWESKEGSKYLDANGFTYLG